MKYTQNILSLSIILIGMSCANAQSSDTRSPYLYNIVDTYQYKTFDNSKEIPFPKEGEAFYGQDAQYNLNTPSYIDNKDGTISDNITGLMWQKTYKALTYSETLKELKRLNKEDQYKDWRLPSIKELYSLMDFSGVDPSGMTGVYEKTPFINTNYFNFSYGSNGDREIDTQLLSSTHYVSKAMGNDAIFGLNVADGRIKGYPIEMKGSEKKYTVRFVRGNKQYGINKFKDNKDTTISDEATGLMWSKDDSKAPMSWEDSFEYVAKLNKENYLGYSDWKIPNAKELQSIVDYTRSPKTTSSPAIDKLFNSTKINVEDGSENYASYWASTTHKHSKSGGAAAVYVSFGEALGFVSPRPSGPSKKRGENSGDGMQNPKNKMTPILMDVHGAGAQRSDHKTGNTSDYPQGLGPQGDVIRIDNFVRVVREIQ